MEAAPPPCTDRPFGVPKPLSEINTMLDDVVGSLSPDGLTLYGAQGMGTSLGSDLNVYVTSRSTKTAAFQGPMSLANVNGPTLESWPVITPDGLTLYVVSDEFGAAPNGTSIFTSRRANATVDFPGLVKLQSLEEPNTFQSFPSLSSDGTILYFTREAGSNWMLYQAACDGSVCVSVQALTELNTHTVQYSSIVSSDGTRIFFAVDLGNGQTDIFTATRKSASQPFGPATAVTELNSPTGLDVPRWLSPDGCSMYFVSSRGNANNTLDIYTATR
jgi:Tol biopolymer transport system component